MIVHPYGREGRNSPASKNDQITAILIQLCLKLQDCRRGFDTNDILVHLFSICEHTIEYGHPYGYCMYCGQKINFLNEYMYLEKKYRDEHKVPYHRLYSKEYAIKEALKYQKKMSSISRALRKTEKEESGYDKMFACSRCKDLVKELRPISKSVSGFMTALQIRDAIAKMKVI